MLKHINFQTAALAAAIIAGGVFAAPAHAQYWGGQAGIAQTYNSLPTQAQRNAYMESLSQAYWFGGVGQSPPQYTNPYAVNPYAVNPYAANPYVNPYVSPYVSYPSYYGY